MSSSPDRLQTVGDGRLWATARPWIILGLLVLSLIVSLLDRMILSVMIDPVRADLRLSDTEISLVQGLAFMFFYTIVAVPLGRLMDYRNRTTLLAAGMALWSISTAACSLASQFGHLVILRMLVGFGEASLIPAAYSLIPDIFPKTRLGLVMGIFALGGTLGLGLSLVIGGHLYSLALDNGPVMLPVIGAMAPWQQAFAFAAVPGLLLSLCWWLIGEPARSAGASRSAVAWSVIWAFGRRYRGWLAPFFLAGALNAGLMYISATWVVSFLSRAHALSPVQSADRVGLIHAAASVLGTVLVGYLTDFFAARRPYRRLLVCAAALALAMAASAVYPLADDVRIVYLLWGTTVFCTSVPIAAAASNLQQAIPASMRGVISSAFLMFVNIMGLVGTNTLVAAISDGYFPQADGIRYALAIVGSASAALAAIFYLHASFNQKRLALRFPDQDDG
jgi:MFS family permease